MGTKAIQGHYTTQNLLSRILAAAKSAGADPDRGLAPADLKPVDEFHMGGVETTEALLGSLAIERHSRVLDIGCGIGGTARLIADRYGCSVTGLDLTPAYVEVARELTDRTGLSDRVRFVEGSALDLPFEDESFDLVLVMHVGMNIADKETLLAEARRVLASGGTIAIFDVTKTGDGKPPEFPLPWASAPDLSHLASADEYVAAARKAGLECIARNDRSEFTKAFFAKAMARLQASGSPPLGIHLLMGESSAQKKIANTVAALEKGRIAPVEMIFHIA